MKSNRSHYLLTLISAAFVTGACQDGSEAPARTGAATAAADVAASTKPASQPSTSPGKPSAPISIEYEVLGSAVVGVPVAVNVLVRSTRPNTPVRLLYNIVDSSALMFQPGQVEQLDLAASPEKQFDAQQITVIPQREGRLYLNVSAEIQTAGGPMLKSMAIPIQVGSAPAERQPAGEVIEGPDGERVISMPATEN